jgi:hypothetical protein
VMPILAAGWNLLAFLRREDERKPARRRRPLVYLLRRGNSPRWLLWAYVAVAFAGFAVMLPISAGFVGTSMQTFNRLMIFQNWI